ncbi:MAG: nucleotidyltransferase domain-containing protein [Candidatus Accumulibacter sp.]|uniref:nucleotidyltransferase domain-containing protein n=1 Tax=Accumulibacter sp. TaxID=2053492 RepID=UPI0019E1D262|nr:nucleotidyltransferase domain-containing protein [Accumulibacter sp.]MBE2259842.1 nucleotidyltransferase domain-containing protein [Paracoccaceae bacterium]MCB0056818.1 nucleotidyltransferase domain-containing protein [Caldilineaceae bacterium]MCP5249534.1 nucleotidyltransferase domain-containing protein [Accumulibacter sp.]
MIDVATIRAAAARLVAAATSPARVILFGSYALGMADEGSDLDLMVIEREVPDRAAEYMRLMDAVGRLAPGVGLDLLIYPLSEFERRGQVPGTVLFEARSEGQVLHDALT